MALGLGLGFNREMRRRFKNRKHIILNGTDEYFNCGNAVQYSINSPFTQIFIFKTNANSFIYSKMQSKGFMIRNVNGKIYIYFEDGTNEYRINTTEAFNDGNWHIGFLVHDGNPNMAGLKIYVDSNTPRQIQNNSGTLTGDITNGGDILIGKRGGIYYDGSLDEIAEAKIEMPRETISKIIGNQGTIFDPTKIGNIKRIVGQDLAAYWRMGDKAYYNGNNVILPDQSGNGNDAIGQGVDMTNIREY